MEDAVIPLGAMTGETAGGTEGHLHRRVVATA
jgi:hypothetical protein